MNITFKHFILIFALFLALDSYSMKRKREKTEDQKDSNSTELVVKKTKEDLQKQTENIQLIEQELKIEPADHTKACYFMLLPVELIEKILLDYVDINCKDSIKFETIPTLNLTLVNKYLRKFFLILFNNTTFAKMYASINPERAQETLGEAHERFISYNQQEELRKRKIHIQRLIKEKEWNFKKNFNNLILSLILQLGMPNFEITDSEQNTHTNITLAIKYAIPEAIALSIKNKTINFDYKVYQKDFDGSSFYKKYTPLQYAIKWAIRSSKNKDYLTIARYLLEAGAKPKLGTEPCYKLACVRGNADVIDVLFPYIKEHHISLFLEALWHGARCHFTEKYIEVIKILLKTGIYKQITWQESECKKFLSKMHKEEIEICKKEIEKNKEISNLLANHGITLPWYF